MPSLVWRATFIDVDVARSPEGTRNASVWRAKTMPCLPSFDAAAELFREECEYVADLDARLDGFILHSETGACDLSSSGGIGGEAETAPNRDADAAAAPLRPRGTPEAQRLNSLVMSMLFSARLADPAFGRREEGTDAETRAPWSKGSSSGSGASSISG
mmetsp:Transcript_65065/g.188665  ORF Transcript_65065/g.188665 Transcript_65065/m.188665 type:complete len:159 (+) Transcript_65065:86-562(+)